MLRLRRKKPKKRKQKCIDPIKEEETAERVAAIEAKRQKIIDEVKVSLERKRKEKLAIQSERFEKEAKARLKELRDAEKSKSEKMMLQIRGELSGIVEEGVKSVYTSVITPEKIKYDGRSTLTINGVKYKINNNLHIIGWGKEAIVTSSAFERIVGKQLRKGLIVVPRKSIFMMWSFPEAFPKLDSRINYMEGGSNGIPDEKSVEATQKIVNYCKKLKKRDLLIVLLCREVDDLLCLPKETITLGDKLKLLGRLKKVNATPEEISVVRNKLSAIRGGDLARLAYPAKIVTLITSALSAKPMELLAGGPCTYDPKDTSALIILQKYRLATVASLSVRELMKETPPRTPADNQLDEKGNYKFVQEYVIACNSDAIDSMSTEVFRLGLFPVKLNSTCTGDIQEFAREYVKLASLMILGVEGKVKKLEMYEAMKGSSICPLTDKKVDEIFPAKDKWGLGLCLLFGGRPIVKLSNPSGMGGPNQELAVYFSLYWHRRTNQYPILREYTVWFAGGSSYGRDGNTKAAGAFGYKSLSTDVYPEYDRVKSLYTSAIIKWRKLTEYALRSSFEVEAARKEAKELETLKEKYAAMLPHRVLRENNTNLMLLSINDGDELLELKSGNYYTFTNVGDLHVIRIVRFQCNCDGACHGNEDTICADRECPVNRTLSAEIQPRLQYCCRVGAPKVP